MTEFFGSPLINIKTGHTRISVKPILKCELIEVCKTVAKVFHKKVWIRDLGLGLGLWIGSGLGLGLALGFGWGSFAIVPKFARDSYTIRHASSSQYLYS